MQAPRLLVIAGGLAVLCGSLYVTFAYLRTYPVPTVANSSRVAESGDGDARELAALRQDIVRLGAELASLRQESGAGTMHSELSRLQNEVRGLRQRLEDSDKLASDDDADVTDTGPETPKDREVLAQEQQQRHFERMQVIETSFQREPIDTQWSADTANLINQALERDELKQTQVVDTECRSTLCRLEITHPDLDAAGEFEHLFPMQVAKTLPQMSYHHQQLDDGSTSTVIYMARESYALPEAN